MAFFKAGKWARERAMISANGVGKTEGCGGYELTLHLTGLYPGWWEGRRFDHPIKAWCAGTTGESTREILQFKLLGLPGQEGTGLIPGETISRRDMKKAPGSIPDAIESVMVKHVSGGKSRLVFKAYKQGRESFQGTEQHVILLDEECPDFIYDECLMRTRTVNGMILLTFTPLMGLTNVVLAFMPNGQIPEDGVTNPSKFIVGATWDDAPHLTEEEKAEILRGTLPHLRNARTKGIPQLGAGAIYPIDEDEISVKDFEIPPWYPRVYALDVGWNCTAALWGAYDKESDIVYFYSCHKQSRLEPETHAKAINSRGSWIPGVADPFGTPASNQRDGKKMIEEYQELGLNLYLAERKMIEAGIFAIWQRLISGRLKIFKSLTPWFNEFRTYHRGEDGKVAINQDNHLMDCSRYLIISGLQIATVMPYEDEEVYYDEQRAVSGNTRFADTLSGRRWY
jgi:phage terminase large subunit-like protein